MIFYLRLWKVRGRLRIIAKKIPSRPMMLNSQLEVVKTPKYTEVFAVDQKRIDLYLASIGLILTRTGLKPFEAPRIAEPLKGHRKALKADFERFRHTIQSLAQPETAQQTNPPQK